MDSLIATASVLSVASSGWTSIVAQSNQAGRGQSHWLSISLFAFSHGPRKPRAALLLLWVRHKGEDFQAWRKQAAQTCIPGAQISTIATSQQVILMLNNTVYGSLWLLYVFCELTYVLSCRSRTTSRKSKLALMQDPGRGITGFASAAKSKSVGVNGNCHLIL